MNDANVADRPVGHEIAVCLPLLRQIVAGLLIVGAMFAAAAVNSQIAEQPVQETQDYVETISPF
jgi:cell division protein FtsN